MDAGSRILCGRCLEQPLEVREQARYLDEYVASLPDSIRAPEAVYRSRLRACERCKERRGFTCSMCGCYVQARAAKRALRCPLPGAPRWLEAEESVEGERAASDCVV